MPYSIEPLSSFLKIISKDSIYESLSQYIKKDDLENFSSLYNKLERDQEILLHDLIVGSAIGIDNVEKKMPPGYYKKIKKYVLFLLKKEVTNTLVGILHHNGDKHAHPIANSYRGYKSQHELNGETFESNQEIIEKVFQRKDIELLKCFHFSGIIEDSFLVKNIIGYCFEEAVPLITKETIKSVPDYPVQVVSILIESYKSYKYNIDMQKAIDDYKQKEKALLWDDSKNEKFNWNFYLNLLDSNKINKEKLKEAIINEFEVPQFALKGKKQNFPNGKNPLVSTLPVSKIYVLASGLYLSLSLEHTLEEKHTSIRKKKI